MWRQTEKVCTKQVKLLIHWAEHLPFVARQLSVRVCLQTSIQHVQSAKQLPIKAYQCKCYWTYYKNSVTTEWPLVILVCRDYRYMKVHRYYLYLLCTCTVVPVYQCNRNIKPTLTITLPVLQPKCSLHLPLITKGAAKAPTAQYSHLKTPSIPSSMTLLLLKCCCTLPHIFFYYNNT